MLLYIGIEFYDEGAIYGEQDRRINALINTDTKRIMFDDETESVMEHEDALHAKVVDKGRYTLYNSHMDEIAVIEKNYVPVCIPRYFDDYVDIDFTDRTIEDWNPEAGDILDAFEKGVTSKEKFDEARKYFNNEQAFFKQALS